MELSQRYIAIEGVPGVGKTALATALAGRCGGRVVAEETDANPFLAAFNRDPRQAAFQAQMFFLFSRFKRQQALYQPELFEQSVITDHHFNRDRIYALLTLSDAELGIYEMIYGQLADQVPRPDLVVYLQARADAVRRRWRDWGGPHAGSFADRHLETLLDAYNHYYFHYSETPLLVVSTGDTDFLREPAELNALAEQIAAARAGTRAYVPAGSQPNHGTDTVLS